MKEHYCPVDKTTISYEGECNWCGEKEFKLPISPLSDEKIRELADKHLSYIAYDEGEYGYEIEIVGEIEFYDAIIAELNKKAQE